jgi:HEAT repeat protein
MDSEKIQILFAQTLLEDYESEEAWAAVSALRMDGSREIFEHGAEWCRSDDPVKRARAAAILCQLRRGQESMYRDESYELITRMFGSQQDALVLGSAISGLGHLGDPNAIPIILGNQSHPDPDVRFAVAVALGCFADDPQAIRGLISLTMDSCSDVRDWSVFGLGVQGDSDSPEIREALLRCLSDTDEDVREEAAIGLGRRRDRRLIPKLRAMLDDPEISIRVEQAAMELLELAEAPPEWTPADYKAALSARFNLEE